MKSRLFIAGHEGMVGSSCLKKASQLGYEVITQTHSELDLTVQESVHAFFKKEKPNLVINAAAKVGGIQANATQPVEFLLQNLQIQNNLLKYAFEYNCEQFLFLGSACVYPKYARQPICESSLLTGPLEPTNEAYAIAKIAGIKLAQAYQKQYAKNAISVMPANLYGPRDNFDAESSHVIPAMIKKFHYAKQKRQQSVQFWGTGKPLREWLYVEDLADAIYFLISHGEKPEILNIGSGEETTIKRLALIIAKTVGFKGDIFWDKTRPDGSPRKFLDSSTIFSMGWKPAVPLQKGIEKTYEWYLKNQK